MTRSRRGAELREAVRDELCLGRDLGKARSHAEGTSSAARRATPVAGGGEAVSQILDLIRATQDRTAAYLWPPAARAFAEGRQPRLTRKGWRIFYQHRQQYRAAVDVRALEVEVAKRPWLLGNDQSDQSDQGINAEGMTLQQFAAWCGVDRGKLTRHLVEIPSGPAPALPPGKIPARKVGHTRRIFKQDFVGEPREQGAEHGHRVQGEASIPAGEPAWVGPLRDLLDS